ncbi:glycosyltransferase [Achromobacter kerstersii]|uniref:glycosyltransferase n=1 Tax=Achromobacter kerstersii TaxID=1353890 RepID=UPI0006C543E9|nr:glycosyltransferase [Achromobacter kerstersii]CUI35765.1 N-glycosyltransferase [Achromobacter kerstersii]
MAIDTLLVPGLRAYTYVSDERHRILHQAPGGNANIGRDGVNLTITCLSLNRAALTEKLLRSVALHVPDFAGEFLVIDNGSQRETLDELARVCEQMPFRTRIVALDKNYGVAGGRNRTMPEVHTEWVLCLDNDIYLTTNILPSIQRDIATLGCHFLNVPLLNPDGKTVFAAGGHLYVCTEPTGLHLGAGSACKQGELQQSAMEPFLSTFLLGGACVLKKATFERVGGYDDNMFVGFEDIDFSVRLFQEGYKVGTTSVLGLIHDHPPPASQSDRDYERERFSRNVIYQSARYLEKKHGFDIWGDGLEHWLELRHEALGLSGTPETAVLATEPPESTTRPKVALVIDVEGWAFSNIARQIQRYLGDRFEFKLISSQEMPEPGQIFMAAADCHLVHFFWREYLRLIDHEWARGCIARTGISFAEFERRFVKNKPVTTSVYDHLHLDDGQIVDRLSFFQQRATSYTVASERLADIYQSIPEMPAPACITQDGVDLDLFTPRKLERFTDMGDRPIVIGWAGNSNWAAELPDIKGFNTILMPAIALLREQGVPVETRFADRQTGYVAHVDMPDYYGGIDLYVCPSLIEGTPNPVLEAMACGVPVISTDVGIVPEAFGPQQKAFIVAERSPEAIAAAIRQMHENRSLFAKLSDENLESIRPWDWRIRVEAFARFFESAIDEFHRNQEKQQAQR